MNTGIHNGKIALVTGSSRGLGKEIALTLAANGADVILTYNKNPELGGDVLAEIRKMGRKAEILHLNMSDLSNYPDFMDQLNSVLCQLKGRETLDILINNAGHNINKAFGEFTLEDLDSLANVHFKGVFHLTQLMLPFLKEGSHIINTSSGLTRFCSPGYSAYASMKGAIDVLTRYLAYELGPKGIHVNCVAPGITQTDFTKRTLDNSNMRELIKKNVALRRIGQPEDIAKVVNFLCSDDSNWLMGQRIEASGGQNI